MLCRESSCKENRGIMFQLVYEMALCQQKGALKVWTVGSKGAGILGIFQSWFWLSRWKGAEVAIHLAKKYGKQVASGSMA